MTRSRSVAGLAAVTALALAAAVAVSQDKTEKQGQEAKAKKAEAPKLPKCPISGDDVTFSASTMTEGGPVYFCCPDCIKKFEAEPKKFADKVQAQRAVLAKWPKVQVKCPVSGKEVSKDQVAEVNGEKVYFCCPNCAPKYKENPAKYKAALLASYTYQTRCPVTGEPIDPTAVAELPDGNHVYYCCMMCDPKLRAEPAKYAKALKEQGTELDLKKLAAGKKEGKEEKHEGTGGEHEHKGGDKP